MQARVRTVAFQGIDVLEVDAQVTIASGIARLQRGRPARQGGGRNPRAGARRACPPWAWRSRRKRITVNLAPADLAKEGSHFDLPIALGLLARHGRAAGGRDRGLHRAGRARARRRAPAGGGRAAGGDGRGGARARLHLPCGLGGGEAAWAGCRDPRGALAARADQSLQGAAGAVAAGAAASPSPAPPPDLRTSRARRPRSARSRSRRRAATIS